MARTGVRRGIDSRVTLATTNINLERWRVSTSADDIPALGFEDVSEGAAFDDGTTGVVSAVINASGYWDSELNPHEDPPGIVGGAILEDGAQFYTSSTDQERFDFEAIRILQCEVNMELHGRADLSFSAKSCGPFTYPT